MRPLSLTKLSIAGRAPREKRVGGPRKSTDKVVGQSPENDNRVDLSRSEMIPHAHSHLTRTRSALVPDLRPTIGPTNKSTMSSHSTWLSLLESSFRSSSEGKGGWSRDCRSLEDRMASATAERDRAPALIAEPARETG
jgi:hypothetical protein